MTSIKTFLTKNLIILGLSICFSCGNPKLISSIVLDTASTANQAPAATNQTPADTSQTPTTTNQTPADTSQTPAAISQTPSIQGIGTQSTPLSSSQNTVLFDNVTFNQTINLGSYQKNINDIVSLGINPNGNLIVFFKTGLSLVFDLTQISTAGYTPTKLENTLAIDSNPNILSLATYNDSWIYLTQDKKLGRNLPIFTTAVTTSSTSSTSDSASSATTPTSTSSKNLFIDLTNGGKSYLHTVSELGIISASSSQLFALTDNYFQVFTYSQDTDKFSVLEIPICEPNSTNCQNSIGVGAGATDTGYWLATTQQFYTFDKDNVKNTYIPSTFQISNNFKSALKVMLKIKNTTGIPKIDNLSVILNSSGLKIQNTSTASTPNASTTPATNASATPATNTPTTPVMSASTAKTTVPTTLSSNFQSQCSICHGTQGEGKLPQFPKLQKTTLSITSFINAVRNGKGVMPPNTVVTDADLQNDYSVLKGSP